MTKTNDYETTSKPHKERGGEIERLITKILDSGGIRVHSVTHRVKTELSASAKIDASPNRYGSFNDLHDLLGVRVITHLSTEVDKVVDELRKEFDLDGDRSVDKLEVLDVDEFGYRSYHLVVKLKDERAGLREWHDFAGIYFEIQVRSILQHAWAEIEHDLGYKSAVDVPPEIHRRFARLAGILELADDEFDRVTKAARVHAVETNAAVENGDNVAVDRDSVRAFVLQSGSTRSADMYIAEALGWTLLEEPTLEYSTFRANELREIDLNWIHDVDKAMTEFGERVAQFAVAWIGHRDVSSFDDVEQAPIADPDHEEEKVASPGLSLFYLYLHMKLEVEGDAFDSVPADAYEELDFEDYDRNDRRRIKFKQIHDRIF